MNLSRKGSDESHLQWWTKYGTISKKCWMEELSASPNPPGAMLLYSSEKKMVLYRLPETEQTYKKGRLSPSSYARTDGINGGSLAFFLHRP